MTEVYYKGLITEPNVNYRAYGTAKSKPMPKKPDEKPKGIKNLWEAGIGAGEDLLKMPSDLRKITWVVVGVTAGVIILIVGTMAFGVGSGKIDVNDLAKSYSEVTKHAAEASGNIAKMYAV
jgi:hypothetical protein